MKKAILCLWVAFVAACSPGVQITDKEYFYRGNELANTHRCQEAISEYQKAIALDDSKADYYYNMGFCYYELQLWDRAIESYRNAVQTDPNYTEAWYNLSLALDKVANPEEARMAYEKYQILNRKQREVQAAPKPKEAPKVLYGPKQPPRIQQEP